MSDKQRPAFGFLKTVPATEQDFRLPEFKEAEVEDYEVRSDGRVVRKDRFASGVQQISSIVGIIDFEIEEVISAVENLKRNNVELLEVLDQAIKLRNTDTNDKEYSLIATALDRAINEAVGK